MKQMKLNWKYVVYIAIGVLLLILTIVTGKTGLSQTDKEIYAKAMELDETVKGFGFNNFVLSDYKVRFFNGNADYVVKGDAVEKEEAVFETFVGTTVEVDGEYQVLLPVYDRFAQMFSVLANAGNLAEGEFSFEEANYSENAHIATLWHEAFHTWQFTNKATLVEDLARESGIGIDEGTGYTEIILNEVDANKTLISMFEQEMQLLMQIVDAESKADLINEVLALQKEREAMLSPQAVFIENYYQTVEGSAKYIEANVYRELEGTEAWEETYMMPFTYTNGSGKYYDMGMLKCMILDQIAPDWKASFDATISLNELLQKAVDAL